MGKHSVLYNHRKYNKWVKAGRRIKLMVSIVLNQLVSVIKGKEGREGIGGFRKPCQVNNALTVTMLPCQVNFTSPVTASKKYARFQRMAEGK